MFTATTVSVTDGTRSLLGSRQSTTAPVPGPVILAIGIVVGRNVAPLTPQSGGRERPRTLALGACERTVAFSCPDAETSELLRLGFSRLIIPSRANGVSCRIERETHGGFRVFDADRIACLQDADELLHHIDKLVTVALQRSRPDLYFLHAAAVALRSRVAVLVAPSGTGKSTLTLALVESGFAYLSDELTAIDPTRLLAHPYPHALCLKSPVSWESPLAHAGTVVGRRLHVRAELLHGSANTEPLPLAAFFFLSRLDRDAPVCGRVGTAAAAARLFANTLNGLAHKAAGLNMAVSLAQRVPCFSLNSSDPRAACAAIEAVMHAP
jgi:hypothetical protein